MKKLPNINYKDAGYYEIKYENAVAELYLDGTIFIRIDNCEEVYEGEKDFPIFRMDEENADVIKELLEFVRELRFAFHRVSCMENVNFMKEGVKYI